jgi:hypothetical protein
MGGARMTSLEKKKYWLGVYLIVIAVVLAYLIVCLWPTKQVTKEGTGENETWDESATILWMRFSILPEARIILLVILIGALGSFVHAATSFATYVGNRSFSPSWNWWYILRPFIGMGLALIFYLVIRGGLVLLSAVPEVEKLSPFGIGAVAALSGLFSKQAADKLGDIFDNIFKTEKGKGDEERVDKLEEARPVTDVMIGASGITAYKLEEGKKIEEVTIKELYSLLKEGITRIPILDDKSAIRYVIHQSMLYKFISDKSIHPEGEPQDVRAITLDDFLKSTEMRDIVEKTIAFVSAKATLGDAKREMERIKNCQDVFVTQNGKREEPILGWLTNTEISKLAKA